MRLFSLASLPAREAKDNLEQREFNSEPDK